FAVQTNLLTDDFAVSAKALSPQTVAENYNVVFTGCGFFRQKVPTEKHRAFHHAEKTGRPRAAFDLFGSFRSGHIKDAAVPRFQRLKRRSASFPLQEIA